jgi:hypothetical protein
MQVALVDEYRRNGDKLRGVLMNEGHSFSRAAKTHNHEGFPPEVRFQLRSAMTSHVRVESVPQRLLVPAKVVSPGPVALPSEPESRRKKEPQGLKPSLFATFAARLKSCPDTKRF